MLRKLMLYPRKNFRFIRACPCDPKRINANISEVPHRKFLIFFQWLVYIKYEWFLHELEMACVFAIKISIYIVCIKQSYWLKNSGKFGIHSFRIGSEQDSSFRILHQHPSSFGKRARTDIQQKKYI